jgi:hypothetical protein
MAGFLAAVASWLVVALPSLLVWAATAQTSVSWGEALGVASAGWYLGHGTPIVVDEVPISVAPLGLWLLALVVTTRSARRLLDRTERAAPGTTWRRQLLRRLLPGFVLGYASAAAVAFLFTLACVARPVGVGSVLVLLVPLFSLAWTVLRRHVRGDEVGRLGEWVDRLPRWLIRGLRPGIAGVGVLLLLGVVLVAIQVVARWSTVTGLYTATAAGFVGASALTAAELVLLPNLAVWALSWLAGPGFQLAAGSSITLSGSHPGLLPMIPVLGAIPGEGTWPRGLLFLLAAPVLVGVGIGWGACRSLARLSSWRTKAATALAGASTTAAGATVLAALGSGSAGVDRLRDVGTHPLLLGLALLGELVLGALVYVLVGQLRLVFRPNR